MALNRDQAATMRCGSPRCGNREVYRARDPMLKRDVAFKVLPSDWSRDAGRVRRFELEAEKTPLTHA